MAALETGLLESRYKVGEVIGSGTAGTVYSGVCLQTGSPVALKIVDFGKFPDPDHVRLQFLIEAGLMRSFQHPNIMKARGAFVTGEQGVLVMDLMEGTCADRAKAGVTEEEAAAVARQVLSAIAYMHALGVAHRDVKPANILLSGHGTSVTARLTDLGLCKLIPESGEVCSSPCGSRVAIAPEMLEALGSRWECAGRRVRMSASVLKSCDIFGLGCSIFGLLCQDVPFRGSTPEQLLKSISKGERSLRESSRFNRLSRPCQEVIRRCCATTRRPDAGEVMRMGWVAGESGAEPTLPVSTGGLRPLIETFCNLPMKQMEIEIAANPGDSLASLHCDTDDDATAVSSPAISPRHFFVPARC